MVLVVSILVLIAGFLTVNTWVLHKIMTSKKFKPKDRWIWSLLLFICPLIGISVYSSFQNYLNQKHYKFYSKNFIKEHLS